jgi:hypothetical protein
VGLSRELTSRRLGFARPQRLKETVPVEHPLNRFSTRLLLKIRRMTTVLFELAAADQVSKGIKYELVRGEINFFEFMLAVAMSRCPCG